MLYYSRFSDNFFTGQHESMKDTNCSGGKEKQKNTCHCKNICKIKATNKFFRDPCENTYKYVYINWICVNENGNSKTINLITM